jgi:hypothetical protein
MGDPPPLPAGGYASPNRSGVQLVDVPLGFALHNHNGSGQFLRRGLEIADVGIGDI